MQATAVGEDAYATKLTTEARRYFVTHSELVSGTNRILKWISVTLLVVTPLRLTIAGIVGACGALLVELTHRSIVLLVRLGTAHEEPSPETWG